MSHVTHGSINRIPQYAMPDGESDTERAIREAEERGDRTLETKDIELHVRCNGRLVPWYMADPAGIGK